ncbi:putative porin [Paraburkholderia sp. BL6665CI2N2]|uniref:porin n=1 Tax=Paraburkholderia sp. BL6665CI2N2 TaxID=1938806 RepID=UPI001066C7E2|nr:porin [Paraburkholderia sp. BL6665CI2N2]TDY15609.1 putative porin [Paraburkholderia sp. BL6665CI2N2]
MSKKIALACALVFCGMAHAQSSVTLYGLIDAGITYTNNLTGSVGNGSALQFISGSSQGDRWGLKGAEDLGGGTRLDFVLENGFVLANGKLGQGGRMFGLQSYVGLSGPWGALTMGRQYDLIGWIFPAYAVASNTPAGLLAWSLPTNAAGGYTLDNRVWGDEVDNSVKYMSPNFGGFSFGAMYGFGNIAGSLGTNSSTNFSVSYDHGPFSATLAYMAIHNVTTSANSVEYAAGTAYMIGKVRIFGLVTDVQLSSGAKQRATTFEGGAAYTLRPDLSLAAGYQFQKRNNDVGSANQLTLSADYFLSKQTDVYLVGALGHDYGYGAQVQAGYGSVSSTSTQVAARVGLRHKF